MSTCGQFESFFFTRINFTSLIFCFFPICEKNGGSNTAVSLFLFLCALSKCAWFCDWQSLIVSYFIEWPFINRYIYWYTMSIAAFSTAKPANRKTCYVFLSWPGRTKFGIIQINWIDSIGCCSEDRETDRAWEEEVEEKKTLYTQYILVFPLST